MIQASTIVGVVSFGAILVLGMVMAASAMLRLRLQHNIEASRLQTKAYKYGGGILPQTHVAPYFTSLLIANFIQAIGSILNINWLIQGGTAYEPACVAQGTMFVVIAGLLDPKKTQVQQRTLEMLEQLYGTVYRSVAVFMH